MIAYEVLMIFPARSETWDLRSGRWDLKAKIKYGICKVMFERFSNSGLRVEGFSGWVISMME